MVTEEDFLAAERELVPSVSAKELDHYKRVRSMFEKAADEGKGSSSSGNEDRLAPPVRSISSGSMKSNGDRKGKGKAVSKGNGKEKAWDRSEEDDGDEDDDQAYMNGYRDKGKGKAVFEEGSVEDEDELY